MSVFIDSEKCKGCGICVSVCPVQAISIIQNKAFINQNRCNECLQCLHECPNNAIYQTSDKEISVAEKQGIKPYSAHSASSQSNLDLESYKRKQIKFNMSGRLLDRIKEVADSFFQNDSSFGRRNKAIKNRNRGHRRRYRGGRFKH